MLVGLTETEMWGCVEGLERGAEDRASEWI